MEERKNSQSARIACEEATVVNDFSSFATQTGFHKVRLAPALHYAVLGQRPRELR